MTTFVNDNGEELQYTGEDVLISKRSATFKNFTIQGDFSVNFNVKNNSHNRKVLGYHGYNQVGNPAYSNNTFKLFRNGNEIERGLLVIQEDNGKELSLFFISGNSNWFSAFNFNCRDIRNTSLNVEANWTSVHNSWGVNSVGTITGSPRDYGIVFPLYDIMYKGQKFDNYFFDSIIKSGLGDSAAIAVEIFPALFVHTLVNELSKVADIKISGNLLEERFYKNLIITPESATLIDPDTEEEISTLGLYTTSAAPYLKIGALAPDMTAVEFIKWLCITFGCAPTYDSYTKTLSLNIIDKFKQEDAEDWSPYLKSYKIEYDLTQNNYIRVEEGETEEYNATRTLKYGELNIQSDKDDNSNNEIYSSPFKPVVDYIGPSPTGSGTYDFKWATPFIPYFELEDDEEISYTSVSLGTNNTSTFNGTGFPFDTLSDYIVFRVEDDNGTYTGYHTTYSTVPADATTITSKCPFNATSTGKIYTQTISKGTPGARILNYIPRILANQVSLKSNIEKGRPGSLNSFGTIATAYFHKAFTGYPALDNGHRLGLSYGQIDGRNDTPLETRYLKNISEAVKKPTLVGYFLLPEAKFKSFNFNKFVYLNTGEINGYFLVESIVNYKDGKTLTEVRMYG